MCGRVACDLGPKLSMLPLLLSLMLLTSLTVRTRASPDYPDSPPSSVSQYLKSLEVLRASADEEEKKQDDQRQQMEEGGSPPQENQPLFSYRFPEEPYKESPFAVKPTNPRYYDPDVPLVRNNDVVSKSNAIKTEQETEKEKSEVPALFGLGKSGEPNSLEEESRMEGSEATDNELQEGNVYKIPIVGIKGTKEDMLFIAIVAGCSAAAVVGVILIGITWYRLHKNTKAAADVEYPAYGVTGPNKDVTPTGDRRLAQSAQMYHYQHQKQQIIAMESQATNDRRGSVSEPDSDEENEEGDYTVYECPGLAATGEMEVKNPLFQDDPTPASTNQITDDTSTSAGGEKK